EQGIGGDAVLNPLNQSTERINWHGSGTVDTAMADPGSTEEAIEALQVRKIGIVAVAIALGHGAVIVDHATRIDELIVRADEREELPAMSLESVQRREGIGHIGDVARAILCDLRVLLERHSLPVEVD